MQATPLTLAHRQLGWTQEKDLKRLETRLLVQPKLQEREAVQPAPNADLLPVMVAAEKAADSASFVKAVAAATAAAVVVAVVSCHLGLASEAAE